MIANSQNLSFLTGDIGNAFIQAHTKENIYIKCGKEFGDKEGSIAIIVRALYGLTTFAERFRMMLAIFLRTLGFIPSCFDIDVCMRMRDELTGYDSICAHVDEFKVVAKNPTMRIGRIASIFLVKEHRPRNYYLGNEYTYNGGQDIWTYGIQTYATEAVSKVERMYGTLPKHSTPMLVSDFHIHLIFWS